MSSGSNKYRGLRKRWIIGLSLIDPIDNIPEIYREVLFSEKELNGRFGTEDVCVFAY